MTATAAEIEATDNLLMLISPRLGFMMRVLRLKFAEQANG
jgi:hypothetical protein